MEYITDLSISSNFFMYWPAKSMLNLQANRLDDMVRFYEKFKLNAIHTEGAYFREKTLDSFLLFKGLQNVVLAITDELEDLSALYQLGQLKELNISMGAILPKSKRTRLALDFINLYQLEHLSIVYDSASLTNLHLLNQLVELQISSDNDDVELPILVKTLLLSYSKRTNLDFFKKQIQTESLTILNGSIRNIDGLIHVKHSLKNLKLYKCSKIENIDVLESLDNLELLGLESFSKEAKLRYAPVLERLKQKGVTIKYYW